MKRSVYKMGLNGIIPFLKKKYVIKGLLKEANPTYYPHQSRRQALGMLRWEYFRSQHQERAEALEEHKEEWDKLIRQLLAKPERSIHELPREYISSSGPTNIVIHTEQGHSRVIIEDWMLALRAPSKIAKSLGYRYTGVNFYHDMIRPIKNYWRSNHDLKCIIIVVDKGAPPEKKDTQDKRIQAARRQKENKNHNKLQPQPTLPPAAATAEANKRKRKGSPVMESASQKKRDTKKSKYWDQEEEEEDREADPPQAVEGEDEEDYPADITITQDGIQLPDGKVVNLDGPRLMGSRTPGLRRKLYEYLLYEMAHDQELYIKRPNEDHAEELKIIFDFDVEGPWMIHKNRTLQIDRLGDQKVANSILEADNACFWWAAHYSDAEILIHAGDTDYFAISLLNAHHFDRSLLIQCRDESTTNGAACIEAHLFRQQLLDHGVGEEEWSLASVMHGTDFVDRALYLYYVGDVYVWKGVALYRHMMDFILNEAKQITSRKGMAVSLNRLVRQVVAGQFGFAEGAAGAPAPERPEWPSDATIEPIPWKLDVVVCCIYLQMYHAKRKHVELVHALSELPVHLFAQTDQYTMDEILSRSLHPVLESLRVTYENKKDPSLPSKTRGLPLWTDRSYHKVLRRVQWNFWYWKTLGNRSLPQEDQHFDSYWEAVSKTFLIQ